MGSCAVMLLIVRRFETALGGGAGEKGFGETRSFFTTTLRRGGRDEDEDADALSFGFGGATGGTYVDGFFTVLTFGTGSAIVAAGGEIRLSSQIGRAHV